MGQVFLLALVGFTSLVGYVVGTKVLGQSGSGIRYAAGKMFECFGLTLVFLIVNLAVGVIAVLVMRGLAQRFMSLYDVNDIVLLMLSLLQGLTFQWWREHSTALQR